MQFYFFPISCLPIFFPPSIHIFFIIFPTSGEARGGGLVNGNLYIPAGLGSRSRSRLKKNQEPEPVKKTIILLVLYFFFRFTLLVCREKNILPRNRSRSDPGVFGTLEPEPEPLEKKYQEPEPLPEPEPLEKKVRSRSR